MGLLTYLTAHSLDEDYEHRASSHAATGTAEAGSHRAASPPGRHVLAMAGLLAFGILVGTAAVQTARSQPVVDESRDSLIEQIRDQRAQLVDARAQAGELRAALDEARNSALQASTRGQVLSDRLERLGTVTGTTVLTGPGLRIEVDDGPPDVASPQVVLDTDLQKLVNGLWVSGAEAVAINGQRITSLSAIRVAGDAITVNFRSLARPFVITALGDPDELAARFVDSDGGTWWLNLKSIYDLTFQMTTEESLTVPAAPELALRHARPLEEPQ